jgi:tetratricopeptide (TPR) repeat protein
MNFRKRWYLLVLPLFFSCDPKVSQTSAAEHEEMVKVVALYYEADTVIRKNDTLRIINSKYDTTIIETGIFTYLKYYYPTLGPDTVFSLTRKAIALEHLGELAKSREYYRKVVEFYEGNKPPRFSDTNDYLVYHMDTSIIYSYAYEKLGDLDKAIHVLRPFLANSETYGSEIHQRFIEVCIKKFGAIRVKEEIEKYAPVVHRTDLPVEYEQWAIRIFDADLGLGNSPIQREEALASLKAEEFYQLLQ